MRLARLAVVFLMVAGGGELAALTVGEVFNQGVQAYREGELAEARRKFELVLENDPGHPAARAYLRRIELDSRRPQSYLDRLEGVAIAGVNFRQATLDSVLDFLVQSVRESSDGELALNFVPKLTADEMRRRRLTLQLQSRVPLTEVLRYVGQLADVNFRNDTHALIVEDKRAPREQAGSGDDPRRGGLGDPGAD